MNFKPSQLVSAIVATGLFLTVSLPVIAAESVLEEVIVTAQKREQSINDIGVSAVAFAGDQLKELGVDQAVDLGAMTPGLITVNATTGSTPIFAIRGIGLDDFNANNTSGVGVYTDEIFASSPLYLNGQLFDVERVEVLKGPQGTLYGKNTTGGAINIINYKPGDVAEAYVEAGYSRYQTFELIGVASGPLSETMRGRLSVNYTKSNKGWQKDVVTGEEYGLQDSFAVRGQLAFDLGDKGEALIRAYYSEDNSKPFSPDSEGIGDALYIPEFNILDSPADPSLVKVGIYDVSRDEDGSGIALFVDYEFEHFNFKSISAIDQYDRLIIDNYDGSAPAITNQTLDNDLEQWSQEFRLIGNTDGAFSWLAGINISHEDVRSLDSNDASFLVTDSVFFGVLDPADIIAEGLDVFGVDYTQKTDSWGVYLHTETEINETLALIAGARFSSDDRSFNGASHEIFFGDSIPIAELNESHKEDAVTGKVGLDWQINDDFLLFGNIATSYKSGAFFAGAGLDASAWSYVDPEDIRSYELGFKWTLLEGSMQLNGSVFRMDYTDRQSLISYVVDDYSNFVALLPVVDVTLINIPKSRSEGFEFDLAWVPAEGWSIQAGLAYLDSKVTKVPGEAELRGIDPDPGANDFATGDLNYNGIIDDGEVAFVDALAAPMETGTILSQAPEWSYNAVVAYEFGIGDGLHGRVQGSYSWLDRQYSTLADPNALSDSVSGFNAQLSIGADDGVWMATLWGRNIFDQDSDTYSFTGFAGRTVYRQMPATYGITLRYRFF